MLSEYRTTAQTTWDAIAESFNLTRQKPWQYCLDFIHTLQPDDIVADLGCGNGRHLFPAADQCTHAIGVDLSLRFLQIIQRKRSITGHRNISLLHADVVHLPITDNKLDAVLFIASLHNIQGRNHRLSALREIARVLTPQGTALISVWSRWQEKYRKYFLSQFFLRTRDFGDIDIFWRQQNLNVPRFYHLYSRNEFLQDLHTTCLKIKTFKSIRIHSTRFPDNFFAVVQKE